MISRNWKISLLILLFGVLIGRRFYYRFLDPHLYITFFDVGQGDAILIHFPYGKTMLVDAGGGFRDWNAGTAILFPELARMGILRIDYAVLSHPDQDHGYGFLGIMEELKVGSFLYNAHEHSAKRRLFGELLGAATKHEVALQPLFRTSSFPVGSAVVKTFVSAAEQSNNRSLVQLLEFAGCRILLTGDMEIEEEANIGNIGKIHFLKVPHHGARHSLTEKWLRSLSPLFAIISVGLGNPYGHPHSNTINRLLRNGAQVLRTDFHGYIRFSISPTGEARCENAHGSCGAARCYLP
ncbi:MAG: MBL fold metallo-hydrolase [Deltaproteobacteria bacterium]|nr:MBL fold metallo-hydrolase [Deltaproteobacteria bacterium]